MLEIVDASDYSNKHNPGGLGRLNEDERIGSMLDKRSQSQKSIYNYQNSMVVFEKSAGDLLARKTP